MSQILSTPSETQTSWLPRHHISVERLKAPTTAGSVLSRLLPEVVQELLGSTNDESTQDDANAQLFEQTHSKPCFTSHDMMTLYSYPGVAVVTGAAGTGIGAATARAFAEAGCKRIAITDRNADLLERTKDSIASKWPDVEVWSEAGDISVEEFVDNFMKNVVDKFGSIDYAVNCAGVLGQALRSHEMDTAEFDRINGINYRGCWLSSRAELKQMVKQDLPVSDDSGRPPQRGAIVNIASQLGIVGRAAAAHYCGSKAAVISMTRCDAIDYSRDHIRINCVCPGVIETPMTASDQATIDRLQPAINIAPMGRMGKPEEIADAALFLCSNRASFIQGHALVVDGGYIIN